MNKIKMPRFALKGKETLSDMPEIYWWLGKISQRKHLTAEAINYYKQAF